MDLIILIIWGCIWGGIATAVGNSKGINGFWWGFFLGLIGVIVVGCMDSKKTQPQETLVVKQVPNQSPKTSNLDKYEELEKLAKLKEQGAITDDEFNSLKKEILNSKE